MKTCVQCGKPIPKDGNYRKKRFCTLPCFKDSLRMTPEDFWRKVDKGPHPKGCWLFTGYKQKFGHGWMGKYGLAHRYAWALVKGPLAKGQCLLHKCDVPACVNPEHLFTGDRTVNGKDMWSKGRGKSKLTPEAVREIRAAFAALPGRCPQGFQKAMAEKYGVRDRTIWQVRRGINWSHVK